MVGFEPGPECRECKGRCCREKGCSLSPEDMLRELQRRTGIPAKQMEEQESLCDYILAMLKETQGNALYAIDRFTTERGPFYYLRMRHKCYTFIGVDAMGECIALTGEGCELSEEQRPKGGRFLQSSSDGHCRQHYTGEMMERDWKPYQQMLSRIWEQYEVQFREDGTFDRCDEDYFAWMRSQREKENRQKKVVS